ncbi:MAG: hypothetical protein M8858_08140 [marine benthic group bacterium]|nr:hypothetical protein [Gemmatimonadota bacterium]
MAELTNIIQTMQAGNQLMYPGGQNYNNTDQLIGIGGFASWGASLLNTKWAYAQRTLGTDDAGGYLIGQFPVQALLDYRFGFMPYMVSLKYLVVNSHTADGANDNVVFFGFGGWGPTPAAEADLWGIGFWSKNGGNWNRIIQDATTTHVDADTGISSDGVARELEIQVDGRDHTVRFYIDGTQVGTTFTFSSPTLLGELAATSQDDGWPNVCLEIWSDGATGSGQGRAYWLAGTRDAGLTLLSGTADGDVGPSKPTETLVLAGASFADVSGSAFVAAPSGLAHYLTQWQITLATDTGFASPVQDVVSNTSLLELRHTGLSPSTNYIARVRYIDTGIGVSEWSDAIAVNTVATDPSTGWGGCP